MKIFFNNAALGFFLFIIAFHLSFGDAVKKIKPEIKNTISKNKVEEFKFKARKEMLSAVEKKNLIDPDDARLINKFLNKVISDLEKNK